jgi:hypothetical protein
VESSDANATYNNPAGGSKPLPIVPPAASASWNVVRQNVVPALPQPPQSVFAAVLDAPAAVGSIGPSVAKSAVAYPAWLGQTTSNSDNSDPDHQRVLAIRALDAVFARYGH